MTNTWDINAGFRDYLSFLSQLPMRVNNRLSYWFHTINSYMKDLVDSVTNLFKTVFDAIVAKPFAAVMTVMVLILMGMTVHNGMKIEAAGPPSVATEQRHMQQITKLNNEIPDLLEGSRQRLGAMRLLVRQFHNGRFGISGIPFAYVQTTYAATAPGRGLDAATAYMDFPISTMSNTLSLMWKNGDINQPQCTVIHTATVKDPMYKAFLDGFDVKSMILCPLIDTEFRSVGVMAASWPIDIEPTEQQMQATMLTGAQVVAKLKTIDGEVQEKVWWNIW